MTIYNDPARALRDSPLRAWNISLRRERVAFNARRRRPSLLTGKRPSTRRYTEFRTIV